MLTQLQEIVGAHDSLLKIYVQYMAMDNANHAKSFFLIVDSDLMLTYPFDMQRNASGINTYIEEVSLIANAVIYVCVYNYCNVFSNY